MPNQPSREELLARLYLIWFYNTYTNIPGDRPEGWVLPGRWPSEFDGTAPREYQPPYPAPSYWPKGPVRFAGEPLFGSGIRITGEFRALRQESYWPTWEEFWGGTPQWPPPWPPMLPDGSISEQPSGGGGWEGSVVPPVPAVGSPNMGLSFPEVPYPPGEEPLPPFPPGHELPPPFPWGEDPVLPPFPPRVQIRQRGRPILPTISGIVRSVNEELCCIGFNPEESMLEAILTIKGMQGYGGSICSQGGIESVGFWLIEPSRVLTPTLVPRNWNGQPAPFHTIQGAPAAVRRFIGEANVRVYDIPRFLGVKTIGGQQVSVGELKYAVRLPLSPDMVEYILSCSSFAAGSINGLRVPTLHCVLAFNQIVNDSNYWMAGVTQGAMLDADIQFPKKSQWGISRLLERKSSSEESQMFPVHVALLKNKKILMFSGSGNIIYDRDPTTSGPGHERPPINYLQDTVALFDPDTETIQKIQNPWWYDTFCAGHSVMADGNVFVAGGTYEYQVKKDGGGHDPHYPGVKNVAIFSCDDDIWDSVRPTMQHGRWYPTTLVLSDGSILIMGGHTDDDDTRGHENRDLEIFLSNNYPDKNLWYYQGYGMPKTGNSDDPSHIGTYPRLHLLPNGKVFSSTYVGEPANEKNNGRTAIWTPPDYNNPKSTSIGSWENSPNVESEIHINLEDHGFNSVMLPLLPQLLSSGEPDYLPRIMILPNKKGEDPHGFSYICEPYSPEKSWTRIKTATGKSRIYGNTVILPDATILSVCGIDAEYGTSEPSDINAVNTTEIFDPMLMKWQQGSSIIKARNYHGWAILMYDGRVLIGGSNKNKKQTIYSTSDWSDEAIKQATRELSLEIYTPDCLWRGPRPVFSVTPDEVEHGNNLYVRLGKDWTWDMLDSNKIGLIRLYSVTHAFGVDQRYVGLIASNVKKREFTLTIPGKSIKNKGLLPPGYYMLFLVSKAGAPSVGHIVHIKYTPSVAGGTNDVQI